MEGGDEIDRISKLPDSLIHEILSFIDMKYAVQTSVLSKRWKTIWMSLPFIKSDWESFRKGGVIETVDRFLTFVDNVFEFRDDSDIQMMHLRSIILDDISLQALNRWMVAAVNYNVQHLDINGAYIHNLAYDIPYELLHCKSLKSLTLILLGAGAGGIDVILPKSSLSLPRIKKLRLGGISISNIELQRLFSSCPLMEEATIQQCHIDTYDQRSITIDPQGLHTFTLLDNHHKHLGPDDHFLAYTDKISAPSLKHFACSGFMEEGFSLENLSSLEIAQFKMRLRENEEDETAETYSELPAEEKQVFAKHMMKFLGAVHNVQHLKLSSGFLEVLVQAPGTLYPPPQLCNLVILELEMRFTRGCFRSIAYLLRISPIIIILKLKSKEPNLADVEDDWEAEFSLPCMFTHLKFVEIREVEGCDNEVKFLRFLLKNSTVLEELNLFFRSTDDSLDNRIQVSRFKRNLRILPTASSNIQMNFIEE